MKMKTILINKENSKAKEVIDITEDREYIIQTLLKYFWTKHFNTTGDFIRIDKSHTYKDLQDIIINVGNVAIYEIEGIPTQQNYLNTDRLFKEGGNNNYD